MQLKRLESVLTTWLAMAMTSQVFAHPGHGTTESTSPLHAAEPVHLLPALMLTAVVAIVGMFIARRLQQSRERK
jgi:NADH:ubiquinone oxidoreductase subunit 5 (subunit L)/multisubunit Na+/H+ antiporter MnhA subunit